MKVRIKWFLWNAFVAVLAVGLNLDELLTAESGDKDSSLDWTQLSRLFT
jgi:hypothetical protein